jgi:tRNA pseudouridine55 synthase
MQEYCIKQDGGYIFNIFKEPDISSNQTLMIFRKITSFKKSGFAGTLDPFAKGVLPIAVNKATKSIDKILNQDKEYLFNIKFGANSDTNDITGNITQTSNKIPTIKECQNAINLYFLGTILQTPPIYSAIKINGKRSCDIARTQKEFNFQQILDERSKQITIKKFDIIDSPSKDEITCIVVCSKGTYIRKLAHDLANKLDSCALVSSLTRTRVGNFSIENSMPLKELEKMLFGKFE